MSGFSEVRAIVQPAQQAGRWAPTLRVSGSVSSTAAFVNFRKFPGRPAGKEMLKIARIGDNVADFGFFNDNSEDVFHGE